MLLIFGRVAQLGERTVRIRKVEGSIPFMSTNKKAAFVCQANAAFLNDVCFQQMMSFHE